MYKQCAFSLKSLYAKSSDYCIQLLGQAIPQSIKIHFGDTPCLREVSTTLFNVKVAFTVVVFSLSINSVVLCNVWKAPPQSVVLLLFIDSDIMCTYATNTPAVPNEERMSLN